MKERCIGNFYSKGMSPWSFGAICIWAIVIILTGIIAGNMPLFDDDIVFANAIGCPQHSICPDKDFSLAQYASEHRQFTNGRVGDMLIPLIMLLPSWIYGIVYGICYGIIIYLMASISGCGFKNNPVKTCWIVILSVLLFPWIDVLYTRAVFFNYFPAIIFALISLRYFISPNIVKGPSTIICFLVAFLTGCWHELIPVALFPSAVLYVLLTGKITRNQWIVTTGMVLGFLIVISAPSFFNRTDQLSALFITDNRISLAKLYSAALICIDILAIVLFYFSQGRKERRRQALIWALVLPSVPSILIMLSSLYETRICFIAMILAICALIFSWQREFKYKGIVIAVTALFALGVIAQLIVVARNTFKVKKASDSIIAQAVANPDGYIYYDLRDLLIPELPTLYKTQSRGYINKMHSWDDFAKYTGYRYTFNILPPALKDFDLSRAEKISDGQYYYDTYLIADAPCDSTAYAYGTMQIAFGKNDTRDYRFISTYFEDINGQPLIYLLPYQPIPPHEKPTEVKLTEVNLHPRIADSHK